MEYHSKSKRHCPNCNSPLPEIAVKYCIKCGYDISNLDDSSQESTQDIVGNVETVNSTEEQIPENFQVKDNKNLQPDRDLVGQPSISKEFLLGSLEGMFDTKSILKIVFSVGIIASVIAMITTLIGNSRFNYADNAIKSFFDVFAELTYISIYLLSAWTVFRIIKSISHLGFIQEIGIFGKVVIFLPFTYLLSASVSTVINDIFVFRYGFNATTGIEFFGGLLKLGLLAYIIKFLVNTDSQIS